LATTATQQRLRVEAGNAHPADAAVEAQRRRRSVADQAEVGQRRVPAVHSDRAEAGLRIEYALTLPRVVEGKR
jgi:hypothetical protein